MAKKKPKMARHRPFATAICDSLTAKRSSLNSDSLYVAKTSGEVWNQLSARKLPGLEKKVSGEPCHQIRWLGVNKAVGA